MGQQTETKQVTEEGKKMVLDIYTVEVKQKDVCEYYRIS